jgi:hypothetical protein
MAQVKKTARPIDSSEAIDSALEVVVSFEFGSMRL